MITDNSLALLIDLGDKQHLITLRSGGRFDTHHGYFLFDAIIGRPWGSIVHTNVGHPYLVLQPSTSDLIRHIKRSSQVIFPKDSAHICMRMNIKPGARVLESGCGSGGLTLALATYVAPTGHVFSQELREDFIALARRNMVKVGLDAHVTFIQGDARDGFKVDEPMDAVFLDMAQPEACLAQARAVLKDGGWFGTLVPTANQVQEILRGFDALPGEAVYGMIEVEEIITRGYKAVADRFRPRDRMIAHTGYLVFARAVIRGPRPAPEAVPNAPGDAVSIDLPAESEPQDAEAASE